MISYIIEYKQFLDENRSASEMKQQDFSEERAFSMNSTEVVAANSFEAVQMMLSEYRLTRGMIINVFEKKLTQLSKNEYLR